MHQPYSQSREPIYIGFEKPVNGLGIAGFVVSITGLLLTFGLICPLGILLSFFALFKKPRGLAVAGLLIGVLGTALPLLAGYTILRSHEVHEKQLRAQEQTEMVLEKSFADVEQFRHEHQRVPAGIEGNKMVIKYKDGWDRELRYDLHPRKYVVRSAGPDGDFETPDDRTREQAVAPAEIPQAEDREIELGE